VTASPRTKETACRFGRADHLIGVVGLPGDAPNTASVGVIVLNSGLVHRIGPFRLHVDMTRRLNALGYPTLRLDLSTLGDSSGTGESLSRRDQITADVADAMRLLGERAGCARFVLVGLCSGAGNAHMAACSEPNVAGAVFLDGYTYRTAGFMWRRYTPKVFHLGSWSRFFSRRFHPALPEDDVADFGHKYPPRAQVASELRSMLDRHLKLYFVYSGGISEHFNHRRQFREYFGRIADSDHVSLSFFEDADHTYVLAGDRQRLLLAIDDWLTANFPITPSASL
jgi:pimeloyl-ACP methyl ester carboxylesterase